VVGDVGLELPRPPYYGKELELRLSRSYGPGRYDRDYEERGLDYPIGYVRWTERRNMRAFLDLVAGGKVNVSDLVTARVPIDEAPGAYDRLVSADTSPLGILLVYPEAPAPASAPSRPQRAPVATAGRRVGVIGAGSFAQRILIPGLGRAGFSLEAVASATGLSARAAADRFDFERADTPDAVLADPGVDLVAIATRHSSHADLARAALEAGKAVFVEKPPCLDPSELDSLRAAQAAAGRPLLVGFNRRHSGLAEALRGHVRETPGPVELLYRINAGGLPDDHWLNDLDEGGGRLVGEGCHFVDFACWLVDALPERVVCLAGSEPGRPLAASQGFSVALQFGDGSRATIAYEASGSAGLPKERVEAHAGGRSAVLDDFRSLALLDERGRRRRCRDRSGKGHDRQFAYLARLLAGEETPTEPSGLDTMEVTFAARRSLETGSAV
jgi:polar amino acid transport system substrate-binding protein